MMNRFSFAMVLLLVVGCTPLEKPQLVRTPLPTSTQLEALKGAPPCMNPALPSDGNGLTDWKYGCFCGKGHPGYTKVEEYYSVKPKDEIDEVCRDHDVCWTIHGENDGECNDEFTDQTLYLSRLFSKADMKSCSNVASEMTGAFLSIFVSDDFEGQPGSTAGVMTVKVTTLPLNWGTSILRKMLIAYYGYPERDELCSLPPIDE